MRTRNAIAVVCVALAAGGLGWWLGVRRAGEAPAESAGPCAGGAKPLYWKAPMDPSYVRDEPGKSPMGMDLVPVCPGEEGGRSAEGVVRISPVVEQNMGVRSEPAVRQTISRRVRTVGRVAYDERRVTHVHTKVQGWVDKLFVDYEGQMVKRGQPLLQVYSPQLVSTQEELLLASRYREQTKDSPFEDVAQGGEALFRATRRRLELFDIRDSDIRELLETEKVRKNLTLYAPNSGVVTQLMVREGMEVGPNSNLYTIADLSRVWIQAEVYEYELPWIGVGDEAVADLSYLPGRIFDGKVDYVYPFLDPKTRTARVRLEFANPELALKPDMYANVTIRTAPLPGVLAVPEEAVIRSGRRSLVIVALGDGRFQPRRVELGLESGTGQVEIRSGLEDGEVVVTSGQFLIDSESKLQEAVQMLMAPTPAEEPDVQVESEEKAAARESEHGATGRESAAEHAPAAKP